VRAAHDLDLAARRCDAGELALAREAARVEAACERQWLVFRREHGVFFRALEPVEALASALLADGARFDALCERLGAQGAEPAAILAWLERWIEDGLIRRPRAER